MHPWWIFAFHAYRLPFPLTIVTPGDAVLLHLHPMLHKNQLSTKYWKMPRSVTWCIGNFNLIDGDIKSSNWRANQVDIIYDEQIRLFCLARQLRL